MKKTVYLCLLIASMTAGICRGQAGVTMAPDPNERPTKFFHLDFVVKEVEDGHAVNSRSYATTISTSPHSGRPSIRTGSKVPVRQGTGDGYSFLDVGVNFDCAFLGEASDRLTLDVTAEVSSFAANTPDSDQHLPAVIRQNRWSSPVSVQLRKPTIIFSSDDLTSKRKMQVELTATPMTP